MTVATILLLAWVGAVFTWVIWTDKWRGILQCAMVTMATLIIVMGDIWDLNGHGWAVIAVTVTAIVVLMVTWRSKKGGRGKGR